VWVGAGAGRSGAVVIPSLVIGQWCFHDFAGSQRES
jgi:hypothetical protein